MKVSLLDGICIKLSSGKTFMSKFLLVVSAYARPFSKIHSNPTLWYLSTVL